MAAIALIATLLAPPPAAAQAIQFANTGFDINWKRYDEPIVQGATRRSWTWGPASINARTEPYAQTAGGQRQVQYFDKARMELNDAANLGGVTNGLLVREMVGGFLAVGDVETQARTPAQQTVAGDPIEVNPDAPTYASFRGVASLNNDNRAQNLVGRTINQSIDRAGTVSPILGNLRRLVYYDENLGHNIPDVFWDFLNQSGPLYFPADGKIAQANRVYDPWQTVMGLPITEPYVTRATVAGQSRSVIVQLFERRALTYDESNSEGFKVEMGNVGQHYYAWRYGGAQPPPATGLVGPLWAWQETRAGDGSTIPVTDPSRYTVTFAADGNLAARFDCNRGTGRYVVQGSQLTITLGATTTAACPPGSQDNQFRTQLGEVTSFTVAGNQLSLGLRGGGTMRLAEITPTSLTGTRWLANGVNNGRNAVESVRTGTELTATFGTDGRVTGSGGCNTFNGPFQVSGNSITIGPLASTRIACAPEVNTQEQAYLAALQAARTYSIEADRLELRDPSGALQVGFVAVR